MNEKDCAHIFTWQTRVSIFTQMYRWLHLQTTKMLIEELDEFNKTLELFS